MTGARTWLPWGLLLVVVAVVGFSVRFALLHRSGLFAIDAYDDGVHYAIAANLLHGRLPYRDVLFLQPPGIVLVAAPFAAAAAWLGDPQAFVLAKAAFCVVGGINASLAAAVLVRFGPGAALVGGGLYAVAFPIVYTERTMTLEPLGTTGVLVALILLPIARQRASGALFLLAGAAAGAAIGLKIWYVLSFLVLMLWARGGRLRFVLGGAAAGLAIYLPFFLAAPARMWQQVVVAQLGRPEVPDQQPIGRRLRSMLGISGPTESTPLPGVDPNLLLLLLGAAAVAVAVVAVSDRRARVLVALLVSGAALLLLSPSYFQHYAILTAAPLALVAGAATAVILGRLPARWPRLLVVVGVVAAAVALNVRHDTGTVGRRPPIVGLQAAAARVDGCVIADDPGLLAGMGTLTRDIAAGCDIRADPSGISYVGARTVIDGEAVDRDRNPVFQRRMVRYLLSGNASITVRQRRLLLDEEGRARLAAGELLYGRDGFRLRATPGR